MPQYLTPVGHGTPWEQLRDQKVEGHELNEDKFVSRTDSKNQYTDSISWFVDYEMKARGNQELYRSFFSGEYKKQNRVNLQISWDYKLNGLDLLW